MVFSQLLSNFSEEYRYYEADLKNFYSYLVEVKGGNDTITLLRGIRTDDIIESIEFNVEKSRFNSKSIAFKYSVAIAQFFRFAISEKLLTNNDFQNELSRNKFDKESYNTKIYGYIKNNNNLKKPESKSSLTDDEISSLINQIDEIFENKKNIESDIEIFAAMIGIKFMILTGVKYNVLPRLLVRDVDLEMNMVTINDFPIRLPLKLSKQVKEYILLRTEMFSTKTDFFFIKANGEKWGETTASSKITNVLNNCIGRSDTTGISKYGIRNLLKGGMGIRDIEKLTSAKEDLIRSCIRYSEEFEKQAKDKYVNMCLASMDIYYRL